MLMWPPSGHTYQNNRATQLLEMRIPGSDQIRIVGGPRRGTQFEEVISRMMLSSIARATRIRMALAPAVQVACRSSSAMKQDTFAEQRAAYKAKMTKLRKAWSEDIVDKNTTFLT